MSRLLESSGERGGTAPLFFDCSTVLRTCQRGSGEDTWFRRSVICRGTWVCASVVRGRPSEVVGREAPYVIRVPFEIGLPAHPEQVFQGQLVQALEVVAALAHPV